MFCNVNFLIYHFWRKKGLRPSAQLKSLLNKKKKVINPLLFLLQMKRGRPTKSVIRQNVIEILHYLPQGYGYEISKIYNAVFPKVTQRSIYYHLRKGVQLQEIALHKVEVEKGNFSWGSTVEKIYYGLGNNAKPLGVPKIKEFLEARQVKREEVKLI